MKKLIFTQGDETRPKVEDLTQIDSYNSSIFSDIYDRAFSLINEITNPPKQDGDTNSNKTEYNRERNNIIAFIGERGSGKTSCLKSVYYSLCNNNSKPLSYKILETKTTFNNQLPIIDPSYFDEHSNIIEIVIAHMFKSFKDAVNRSNHSLDGDNLAKKRELVKKFQEVKDALDCTKARDKRFNSNDSIEQLSKLASGSNLHDSMEELVDCYLNYFKSENDNNSQMLVIAIDDLDVQTNHTYQMVEQIRKYLIIDKVLILMGVKLVQLSDLIKKKFVEDFKHEKRNNDNDNDNDNNLKLTDQIDDMVARYLMKLLPLSHRLNLPSFSDMPEIELAIVSYVEGRNDNGINANTDNDNKDIQATKSNPEDDQTDEIINLHETILALIYKKTGVMFYNIRYASLIVPHNLRELLNMIAMLNNMGDEKKDQSKNRIAFKHYFIESWCLDNLRPSEFRFVKLLNDCEPSTINQFIIESLDLKCFKIVLSNSGPYYSIADINHVLYAMSMNANNRVQKFAFAIRTVYSMILHSKYEEITNNSDKLTLYTNLFFKYQSNGLSYKLSNKLNHIFDYEKMIGGNLLYLDYQTQTLNIDLGELQPCKINKYYEWLKTKIAGNLDEDFYNNQKSRFNTLELLLLSKYDIDKTVYNSFPIEESPADENVKYSTSGMLYNINRYINLYCIYNKLKEGKYENKIIQNMELIKFFEIVDSFKEHSIIKQLIQKLYKINNLAIINIETLWLLNDYLKEQTKKCENDIEEIVKNMMDYKYFVYNIRIEQQKDKHKEQNISLFKIRTTEHNLTNIAELINPHVYLLKVDNLKSIFNEYE